MRKLYGMVTCVTMCVMLAACGNVTPSGAEDGSTQSEYVVRANAEASGESASMGGQESSNNQAKEEETASGKTEENASRPGVENETKNVEVTGSDVTQESAETVTQKVTEKATEAVTQKATEKATEAVTQKATQEATEAVTQKATEAATQEATEAATQATVSGNVESPTELPVEPSNENVTQPVVEIPVEPVTEALAEVPTEVPTEAQTEAPTEAPALSEMEMRIANNVWIYSEYIQKVIGLVNAQRKENGLSMLQYDATLCKIATHRCFENVDNNMFDHIRPNGTPCFTIFGEYGLSYVAAAENIAAGQTTPEQVVDAWMASPGHRENILGDYTHIGVGVAVDASGCIYWTQSFIKY